MADCFYWFWWVFPLFWNSMKLLNIGINDGTIFKPPNSFCHYCRTVGLYKFIAKMATATHACLQLITSFPLFSWQLSSELTLRKTKEGNKQYSYIGHTIQSSIIIQKKKKRVCLHSYIKTIPITILFYRESSSSNTPQAIWFESFDFS